MSELKQALGAVDRGGLNKRLLDELEKMSNVKLFFNYKLTGADFDKNLAWLEKREPGSPIPKKSSKADPATRAPEVQISFDFMIGADGAHSAVRYHLMKFARVSYQQEYIDTLWCEFQIPPTGDGNFRLSPNHLHIWPGRDNMFIAIPSIDKTFTSTLFMPASEFNRLNETPDSLLEFFNSKFPGVVPNLISEADLRKQYNENSHLPLISIKCSPYHYKSSVVIIGDAAHAMVPFYGQGMNAGFEDVRILFDFLDSSNSNITTITNNKRGQIEDDGSEKSTATSHQTNRADALSAYTTYRHPDAAAIIDLALRNYQEMRSDVQSPYYRLRKWIEETLAYYVPSLGWATQYSRISFGNERYSDVIETSRKQLKLLQTGLVISTLAGVGGSLWVMGRFDVARKVAKLIVRPLQYGEYARYWLRRGGS